MKSILPILLLLLQQDAANALDVKARCTDNLEIYADGVLKGTHNSNTATKTFTLADSTEIVAIKCDSTGSASTRAGIFASFNREFEGDYQTDSTWRCSNTLSANWQKASFDDSSWGYAETSGTNAATANGLSRISSLPSHIKWIWSALYDVFTGDKTVYCRGYLKISQTYDSYGRRFVMGFMDNYETGSPRKDLQLLFTTLTPTDVTVYLKTPRLSSSSPQYIDRIVTVKAGEVKTETLPNIRHYDSNMKDYGILALASQPVKIIGLNTEKSSTDMVLMVPITSLGTSASTNTYYTINWDAEPNSRVLLVADNDNTQFTITATGDFTYAGSTKTANTAHTFTFTNKYQSVQLMAAATFTGTKIESNKPLVVYSGNELADVSNEVSGATRDHLVEQLMPTRNWGKEFLLTPLPYFSDPKSGRMAGTNGVLAKYKYIAAESGTSVTIKNYNSDGTQYGSTNIFALSAGGSKLVSHTKGKHAVVTSNKGIQVAQFATTMVTASATYGTAGNCMGDPWLQLIPPTAVFSRDYGLITPALSASSTCPPQHFVTIIVDKNEKNGITLDNVALDWSTGVNMGTTNFVYITKNIPYHATNGIRIQHSKSSVSFGVYFFGYGTHDSYATMGGTRMAPINEPCQTTSGELGDGLDNNCNGLIDEEDCSSVNDPNKDCGPPEPVNGNWSSWSNQGLCVCPSGSSSGKQSLVRTCSNPVPKYNGLPCDTSVQGSTKEENCQCTPVDGGWSNWGSYSSCSTTCGPGTKSRTRTCSNPFTQFGGADCPGNATEDSSCQVLNCPIDGDWSVWSAPGSCECPSGSTSGQARLTRTCTNPAPQYNGQQCNSTVQGDTKYEACNCTITTTTTTTTTSSPASSTQDIGNLDQQNQNADGPNAAAIGGGAAGGVAAAAGLTALVVLLVRRRKKQKENEVEDISDENSASTTTTGHV